MKKLMIALACASLSANAFAQQVTEVAEVPTQKYSVATNSFWSNWFIQVGADANLFKNQSSSFFPLAKGHDAGSYGFSLAVGKYFTPGLGLRLKADAPTLFKKDDGLNHGELHGDVLFNLSNLFCGYSETRVWNLIPYVGAGAARNFSTDSYTPAFNAGIISTWKLGRKVNLFLEGGMMATSKTFAMGEEGAKRGWHASDKDLRLELGLIFNLGKGTWSKTPDVDALMAMNAAQLDALNASLAEQQAENARLKDELAKKPKEVVKVVEKGGSVGSAAQSIFFNIGSSKLASKKETVNLEALANYAKDNDAKVYVTGYADSATGSASYNEKLSLARANTVADKLASYGVNRDNIVVEGKGGVNTLNPKSYNRRVVVEVK